MMAYIVETIEQAKSHGDKLEDTIKLAKQPAYISGLMEHGDEILEIDGAAVTKETLASLLIGCDIPGSTLVITAKKARGGAVNKIPLVRMKTEDIADRRKLFELFTSIKNRAISDNDRTLASIADETIDLWTRMYLADNEHDKKIESNVQELQETIKVGLERIIGQLPCLKVEHRGVAEGVAGEGGAGEGGAGQENKARHTRDSVLPSEALTEFFEAWGGGEVTLRNKNELLEKKRDLERQLRELEEEMARADGGQGGEGVSRSEGRDRDKKCALPSPLGLSLDSEEREEQDVFCNGNPHAPVDLVLDVITEIAHQILDISQKDLLDIETDIETAARPPSAAAEPIMTCVEVGNAPFISFRYGGPKGLDLEGRGDINGKDQGPVGDVLGFSSLLFASAPARPASSASTSVVATRATVGIIPNRNDPRIIDQMILGGPAHSSQLLARGDEILRIDGVDVTKETSVALLIGDDMPGSKVVLFVKKGDTGNLEHVELVRIAKEKVADRCRLFELFKSSKERAIVHSDAKLASIADEIMSLWNKMSLVEVEQKWKIAKNVQQFQKELTGKIECILDRLPNLKESEVIRTLGKNFEEKLADCERLAMLLRQNYDEKLADSQIIIADQINDITELKGRLAMLALLDENELKQVREMHNEDRTLLAKQDLEIKLLKERLNEAETKTEVRRVSAGREMTRELGTVALLRTDETAVPPATASAPAIPQGPTQKELDDLKQALAELKQALAEALKDKEDLKKKLAVPGSEYKKKVEGCEMTTRSPPGTPPSPGASQVEAWDEAVPFTLTLDADLQSIGDEEAFKRDVIQDVATAAKIDAKHVRVTGLRAGSVLVDMLIAKEAGDAQDIVRDLEEQVKWPSSLLMQGKVTSKAKKSAAISNLPEFGAGSTQKELDDLKQALAEALKDKADSKQKLSETEKDAVKARSLPHAISDPAIPPGPTQKDVDNLKQALAGALKDKEDLRKKLAENERAALPAQAAKEQAAQQAQQARGHADAGEEVLQNRELQKAKRRLAHVAQHLEESGGGWSRSGEGDVTLSRGGGGEMGVNELVEVASADALPGSMSSSFVAESRGVGGNAFAFKEQVAVEAEAFNRQLFEEPEGLESLGERASTAREPQKPSRLEQLFEQPKSLRSLLPLPPSEQEAKHDSSTLAETQAGAAAAEESGADKDRTSRMFQGQLQKAKEIQALQESLEHAAATAAAAAAAAADKVAALAAEKTATEERAAAAEAAAEAQAEALKHQLESKDRALKEALALKKQVAKDAEAAAEDLKHQLALKESAFKKTLALRDKVANEAEAEVENLKHQLALKDCALKRATALKNKIVLAAEAALKYSSSSKARNNAAATAPESGDALDAKREEAPVTGATKDTHYDKLMEFLAAEKENESDATPQQAAAAGTMQSLKSEDGGGAHSGSHSWGGVGRLVDGLDAVEQRPREGVGEELGNLPFFVPDSICAKDSEKSSPGKGMSKSSEGLGNLDAMQPHERDVDSNSGVSSASITRAARLSKTRELEAEAYAADLKQQIALKESAFKRALALKEKAVKEAEAEVENLKHQVALKESAFKRALALKDTPLREAEAEVENLKHQLARNESAVKRAVAAALAEKPVAEDLARRELQKELAEKRVAEEAARGEYMELQKALAAAKEEAGVLSKARVDAESMLQDYRCMLQDLKTSTSAAGIAALEEIQALQQQLALKDIALKEAMQRSRENALQALALKATNEDSAVQYYIKAKSELAVALQDFQGNHQAGEAGGAKALARPPAWDEAVPFTLTLDADLQSIGDEEAFKRDVIQDVATAAKIDAKHVRVTGLRAGSVLVDMLIAKEAGDAQDIVRDLEEQVKWPSSLLMQGKVTSKAKKSAAISDLAAAEASPAAKRSASRQDEKKTTGEKTGEEQAAVSTADVGGTPVQTEAAATVYSQTSLPSTVAVGAREVQAFADSASAAEARAISAEVAYAEQGRLVKDLEVALVKAKRESKDLTTRLEDAELKTQDALAKEAELRTKLMEYIRIKAGLYETCDKLAKELQSSHMDLSASETQLKQSKLKESELETAREELMAHLSRASQDCQDQESVNAALAQELRASKLKESELLSAANAREAISDASYAEVVGLDAKVQELTASIHELEAGVNERDEKLIQLKNLLQASWKRELELQAQRSRSRGESGESGESALPPVNSTHVLEAGVIELDETLMQLKNLLQASWKRELEFQEHQSESESLPPA